MIRVFLFFGMVFLLALGFTWMADLPSMVRVSWNGYVWEQPPVVAALVAGILLAVFLVIVWAVRVVLKSPQIAGRFFRQRRKDKGYAALSAGLIALGTGDAKLARRHALEADKLLPVEPAAKLLLAQTAQLAGKDDEARQRFEAMLDAPETKALGLHGLFVEAERHKEPVAARHYAEEAAKTAPGLEWAGKAVLGYQAVAHHWDEALKTLERNYAAKLLDKKSYRRQRAVILTALAMKLEDGEPERAYSLAKEAHGLALDLVPAAVLTARLATRRADLRKAAKVLEATWRLAPHPELAAAYAHVRSGDSAVDRLKRVKSLAALRAGSPEGGLAVARAALEAREFDEARGELKKVLQSDPSRAAFLLMAELEEAEHGDEGRMRGWLARALKAPQDKAWIADGLVSADWHPVSPVTGKLDAFQWQVPGSALEEDEELVLEDSLFEAPALPVAPAVPAAAAPAAAAADAATSAEAADMPTVDLTPVGKADPVQPSEAPAAAAPAADGPAAQAAPEPAAQAAAPSDAKKGYEGTTDDVRHSPPLSDLPDSSEASGSPGAAAAGAGGPEAAAASATAKAAAPPAQSSAKDSAAFAETASDRDPKGANTPKASVQPAAAAHSAAGQDATPGNGASEEKADSLNQPIQFPLSRMPDDPGTEEEDDTLAKSPRPRFFN